jgi:quercetin dioxygenase-like cupin family protein
MRTWKPLVVGLIVTTAIVACDDAQPTPAQPDLVSLLQHPGTVASVSGDIAMPGGVTLEPLVRGAFPIDVDGMFKFRYDRGMQVVHVRDLSDVVVARLTIAEGGSAGWHRHPGTAIINVVSGTFGVIEETDCVLRTYTAGEAVFHRGQGIMDVGFNAGEGDVVAYVTFMGVPPGQPATIGVPHGEAPC